MDYLDHLNPPQREAVLHKDGPVLVVAGAGAGKTRTLVYRIHHLIKNGVAPETILAVTFTNKAANEMRRRIRTLLGLGEGGYSPFFMEGHPFIGTFHALGIRILREKGGDIGVPKNFVIKDRDGALALIKEAMDETYCDRKQFEPRRVQGIISREKGELSSPDDYLAKKSGGYGAQKIAAVWRAYEKMLHKEKACDFDDLLVKPVLLLQSKKEARDYFRDKWRYILIDEYQDTNRAQYILSKLLAEPRNNICAVGDVDQCLLKGTRITTMHGNTRPIETIRSGEKILSNYGSGSWRPAKVRDVFSRLFSGNAITITTESGLVITSTPEHIHFAKFRPKLTPQTYFVYLMYKQKIGFRLGISQMYTQGQKQPTTGFIQRCNQEHGDCVWIIGTHNSTNEAREREYTLSLKYQIPTIPFVARKGLSIGGYVHDQHAINRIYKSLDTLTAGRNLLRSCGLSIEFPHHRAQIRNGNRRNIIVTLCGDKRGKTPMHRISVAGNDVRGKNILSNAGFSVRLAKRDSYSWRFETCRADYGEILKITERVRACFPNAVVVKTARLGENKAGRRESNSLAFLPAASIMPGMALFNENGGYDVVASVKQTRLNKARVYDLNIEKTHNFIANGIVTHNSIYGWRGSSIRNILQFEKDYPNTKVVLLEENYRSTAHIIRAANEIIGKNRLRIEKNLFTKNSEGEKISLFVSPDEKAEAFRIARKAKALAENGVKREDMAVLYRANFQSRALEEAFLALEIPYQVVGTRFFERKEVKDILAFLNAARNPDSLGDIKRVINVPPRGIGKTTVAKVFSGMRAGLPHAVAARVNDFYALLARIEAASREIAVADLVLFIFKESGLEAALKKEGEEGAERMMNIQELATLAKRYDMLSKEKALDTFLEDTALLSDEDSEKEKKGGVRLMTVHAAKGLEFPYVFITGLEDGLFPHESFGVGDASGGLGEKERAEEERRLFYVAVTRAAKKLFLSYAETRTVFGSRGYNMPSPFLSDIPEELLEYEPRDDVELLDMIERD